MKTLIKKSTHIAQQRQKNLTQIERICYMLGWSHDDYCRHQYAEYEMFIRVACTDLPSVANQLRYSPQFRGFFNNEWMTRNECAFLPFAECLIQDSMEVDTQGALIVIEGIECGNSFLVEEYFATHAHRSLFCDADFKNRYAHMIERILPYV